MECLIKEKGSQKKRKKKNDAKSGREKKNEKGAATTEASLFVKNCRKS